jgi:hypothetical protein
MKISFRRSSLLFLILFAALSVNCEAIQKILINESCCCDYDQGHGLSDHQMVCAYNAPARIDVCGSWDIYISGDFTYWMVTQQGLETSVDMPNSQWQGATASGQTDNYVESYGKLHKINPDFHPGFKAELGLNFYQDNWTIFGEYTWIHFDEQTSNATMDLNNSYSGLFPIWSAYTYGNSILNESAEWRFRMHIGDLSLSRAYYIGTNLTLKPYLGLRSHWINQNFDVKYYAYNAAYGYVGWINQPSESNQHSWAIGPRIGTDINFIFDSGFRFIGKAAYSLQYQHFNVTTQNVRPDNVSLAYVKLKNKKDYVTQNTELGIGLGWGSYFFNDKSHFDLAATYDFQIFTDQNMMRTASAYSIVGFDYNVIIDQLNLFIHGLTIKMRFDF